MMLLFFISGFTLGLVTIGVFHRSFINLAKALSYYWYKNTNVYTYEYKDEFEYYSGSRNKFFINLKKYERIGTNAGLNAYIELKLKENDKECYEMLKELCEN